MAINKITDEKINKLRKKSAKALPDKPSERGYTADQLKNAFSGFVVDDENSVIEEINKLIDSINAEFNKLVGTSDSNGTIIDKISKTFQSQNPILSLNSDSNGKLKYTTYNNRHNVEIDIVPSNTVISSQNDLCTLDGKVVLDKKALLNRISTLEENYNALTENAPETLDTITEIAAALKNNSNIIDTLVVKENGKGLSTNDFTNAHKEKLDNLNGLMVTESEKNIWNSKSDFSGSYDDLIDKPNLDAYVKNIPGAFDYENLNNIPEIPSIVGLASEEFVNQKINDLIGSAPENLNTLKELADMLTNQQSTIGNINQILSSKASVTHTHTKSDITNFPDIYYKLEQMIETDNSKHFTKAEKEKVATIDNKLNSNLGSNESNKILITDENGDIKTALAGSTTLLEDSLESTSVITAPTANQVRILNNIKLDINQSTNNAGKYMKVGTDGNLIPFDIEQEYKKFTTDSISNLPTKEYINNNYLPLSGGVMTGELYMHRSGSVDTMMKFKRTDIGTELFVGIGEGGTNHGLYSKTLNKWMVYADANNVTLNGNAQTATKATQDGSGNNIVNTYAKKTEIPTNYVTTNTSQTITGYKKHTSIGVDTINGATKGNAIMRQNANTGNVIMGSNVQALRLTTKEARPKVAVSGADPLNESNYVDLALKSDVLPRHFLSGNSGRTAGVYTYYKLASFPTDDGGNSCSLILNGRIGGWNKGNKGSLSMILSNRDGVDGIGTILGNADTSLTDLVVYTSGTSSSGSTATLYIKTYSWFAFDLTLGLVNGSTDVWDGVGSTTTPSGTLAWSLSSAKSKFLKVSDDGSCNVSYATKSWMLDGFASRPGSQTWGNQAGTYIFGMDDSTGGSLAFRRDNPGGGQLSMVLDGTVYVNEGNDRVATQNQLGTQVTYSLSGTTLTITTK